MVILIWWHPSLITMYMVDESDIELFYYLSNCLYLGGHTKQSSHVLHSSFSVFAFLYFSNNTPPQNNDWSETAGSGFNSLFSYSFSAFGYFRSFFFVSFHFLSLYLSIYLFLSRNFSFSLNTFLHITFILFVDFFDLFRQFDSLAAVFCFHNFLVILFFFCTHLIFIFILFFDNGRLCHFSDVPKKNGFWRTALPLPVFKNDDQCHPIEYQF